MQNKGIVLLLTASVNVFDMVYTNITSANDRIKQYEEAIKFYMDTEYNIVVVENTGYDFSYLGNNEKFEALSFLGNDHKSSLGKGYGEAGIIEYALNNSKFIKEETIIVKITGRLMVLNLNKVVCHKNQSDVVYADITWDKQTAYSHFFISNKRFLTNYFLKEKERLNDFKGVYFEHVLMSSIKAWIQDYGKFYVLKHKPYILGFSGSTGKSYEDKGGFLRVLSQLTKYYWFKLTNVI